MADALFKELVNRLKFDGIDIDTWVFKFYSRVTVGLFWVAAAVSVADSLVDKNPIECKSGDSYDTNYCYLHGVAHLLPNGISADINDADCFSAGNVGEEKISNYYLWISLVLFLCGAAFAIPNEIWKHFEGGVLKQFEGLQSIELEDEKEKEKRKKAVSQFKRLTNNFTNRYFYTFVFFELVYCILGVIIFNLIDLFLDGKFQSYGSDTFAYLSGNSEPILITDTKDKTTKEVTVNPMCNVFPTVVSCTIKTFSVVQGEADTTNKICILGRNILNQQIFLVLWVWFMILCSATVCQIIYRLVTLLVPSYQRSMIQYHLKSTDNMAVKQIDLGFGKVGNWFLLTQIGSNSDPYAFRKFLEEVTGVDRKGQDKNKKEQEIKKRIKIIEDVTNNSNPDNVAIYIDENDQKENMLKEED